jgi:hypothetical protein
LMSLQLPKDLTALPGVTREDLDAAGLYYVPLPDGRYLIGRGDAPSIPDAAPDDDAEAARSEDAEPTGSN